MSISKGPKKGRSQVMRGELSRLVKMFLLGLRRRSSAKPVNLLTFCSTIPDSDIIATLFPEEETGTPFFSR
jgi:hypothetical protein